MFVLVEKGCLSVFGEIISKGEVIELEDAVAKRLMKSPYLKLVEVEPDEETKEIIEEAEKVEEPKEPEEPKPKRTRKKKEEIIPPPDIEGAVGE